MEDEEDRKQGALDAKAVAAGRDFIPEHVTVAEPQKVPLTPVMARILSQPPSRRPGDAVILGSTGELRERYAKTARGPVKVITHVARGVDPKILKAQKRAMLRKMQGRWDGGPK